MSTDRISSPFRRRVTVVLGVLGLAGFQLGALTYGPPAWPLPARSPAPLVRIVTPAPLPDGGSAFTVASAATLLGLYERAGYDLEGVRAGETEVPRLYLSVLPADFASVEEIGPRKDAFLRTVLPLILRANDEIAIVRTRVSALLDRLDKDRSLRPDDTRWLATVARQYGVIDGDSGAVRPADLRAADLRSVLSGAAGRTLLRRVDTVPVALALAQAIVESGWGRSRFALEGNAIYGQWTWDKSQGMAPAGAPDAAHAVRAFGSLAESVRGYMHNLNTHPGYREFRAARARGASARSLAGTLFRYSERGAVYGEELVTIMAQNDLDSFADARLGATHIRRGGAWDDLEDVPQS